MKVKNTYTQMRLLIGIVALTQSLSGYDIPLKPDYIVVDGSDTEWSEESGQFLYSEEEVKDVVGTVKLVWDLNYLYLYTEVDIESTSFVSVQLNFNVVDENDTEYSVEIPVNKQINNYPRVFSERIINERKIRIETAISWDKVFSPVFFDGESFSSAPFKFLLSGLIKYEDFEVQIFSGEPDIEFPSFTESNFIFLNQFELVKYSHRLEIREKDLSYFGGVVELRYLPMCLDCLPSVTVVTQSGNAVNYNLTNQQINIEIPPITTSNRIIKVMLNGSMEAEIYQTGLSGNPFFKYPISFGARQVRWFGSFDDSKFPWVNMFEEGWFFVSGHDEANLYVFDLNLKIWYFLSREYFPYVFVYENYNEWAYYYQTSMGQFYYLIESGVWISRQ